MPNPPKTPTSHESEHSTRTNGSRIARWSRLAVFASALSAVPACAPNVSSFQQPTNAASHTSAIQPPTKAPQPEIAREEITLLVSPQQTRPPVGDDNSDELVKKDIEFWLNAIYNDPMMLNKADPALKNDRNFMKYMLENTPHPDILIQIVPKWVTQDEEMMVIAAKRNIALLQFADDSLKNNQVFMMSVIQIDGIAIKYASERLRKDPAMALVAVSQNGLALEYLKDFANDIDMVIKAIRQNPMAFQYASEELRAKGKILMIALRQPISNYFSSPLEHAHPDHKRNRMVVSTAINQYAGALEFADPILKRDRGVVMDAAQQDESVLKFADPSIRETIRRELQAQHDYRSKNDKGMPKHILPEFDDEPKVDLGY